MLLVSGRGAGPTAAPERRCARLLVGQTSRGIFRAAMKSMVRSSRITRDAVADALRAEEFDGFANDFRPADFSGVDQAVHALAGHEFIDGRAGRSSEGQVRRRQSRRR